jgi:hypothetical protein
MDLCGEVDGKGIGAKEFCPQLQSGSNSLALLRREWPDKVQAQAGIYLGPPWLIQFFADSAEQLQQQTR